MLLREFRGFLLTVVTAVVVSTLIIYYIYPSNQLPDHHHTLLGTLYDTFQLIFLEAPLPFVDDWRLVPLFFGLPILGLLVIIDGAVRLGNFVIQRKKYTREWQAMLATTYENHVIVCGLGNVGIRIVENLLRFGEDVVCIERQAESPFFGELHQKEVPALVGDARNPQILEQANIRKANALLAVTDDDLCNLETALNAREMCPGLRIVMRMFDQKLAQKIEKAFGINCAFSTSALSAPVFAQSALSEHLLSSFEFGGSIINALELYINPGSAFIGQKIDNLRHDYEVTILMHERVDHTDWNPPPDTILKAQDRLLVLGDRNHVRTFIEREQGGRCLL